MIHLQTTVCAFAVIILKDLLTYAIWPGNAYRFDNETWPADPHYDHGRFSNGPVWVEDLAGILGVKLHDYAVGGGKSMHTVMFMQWNKLQRKFLKLPVTINLFKDIPALMRISLCLLLWIKSRST